MARGSSIYVVCGILGGDCGFFLPGESFDEVLYIHLVEFWHYERITDSLSVRVECLTLPDINTLKLPQKLR